MTVAHGAACGFVAEGSIMAVEYRGSGEGRLAEAASRAAVEIFET